ncbi:MAG: ATP-binding cassette domain-containing protein [Mycoplasmataceae bacterium]|nr:ATP-binding cassette domain-containing protein [Mycoplasmataceae bacterium]
MQIKINKISHTFSKGTVTEQKALIDASANIKQGEFITIIGPTGSGKTTFIEHLNVLLRPSTGSIKYYSNELRDSLKKNIKLKKKGKELPSIAMEIVPSKRKLKEIKKLRKQVGVVFQFAEYQLFEETIEKDIIFGPISMGMEKAKAKELAKKYIKLVGLDEKYLKRSPFALSGGQKRRVALAGVLSMEPEVLIFDEPTAGLDPQGEIEMYKIFKNLNKAGKTIIIVTHNMNHVLEHSTRTIIFNEAKIVEDGKSLDLMYDKAMLEKNDLEVPSMVDLVISLEEQGKKIGKVRNIEELVKKI